MHKRAVLSVLLASLLLFPQSGLRAEGVTIEGNNPRQSIKLTIDASTMADALQAIHEKFGIEITGSDSISDDDPITTTYSGSLASIVNRLLRNQNFVIVRSSKASADIEKIQISGSTQAIDLKKAPNNAAPPSSMP